MNDEFSRCHPVVNFLYFALVIAFSMCCVHPACLLISLLGAVWYVFLLRGRTGLLRQGKWLIPVTLCAAVLNPAFTHQGVTILGYLPSGNPLTLESILYGFAAAGMLAAVFLWFVCYTDVMTSDKFIYLFGRVIPALSLVLSMTLRFVPRFKTQMRVVAQAQKAMGRGENEKNVRQKVRSAVKVFSIMVPWSLESAIETADSMRSRGYGEKGRTAFSIYRFDDRDKLLLLWLGFCGVYLIAGALAGGLYFQYYPMVLGVTASPIGISFFVVYGLMCLTPVILDVFAARQWKGGSIRE